MSQWYCSVRGVRYGPVSQEQLLSWIAAGRVRADDSVWREGMADWVPAGSAAELAAATAPDAQGAGPPLAHPQAPQEQVYRNPHRGAAVLVLGVCGIMVCFICGIIAWVMGNTDLREMAAGTMDPAGEGMTKAGKICGMIGVILAIVGIGIWVLAVIVIAMARTSSVMIR